MDNKQIKTLAVQIADRSLSRSEMIRARSDIVEEYDRRVAMGKRSAPEFSNDELGWITQLEAMRVAINELLRGEEVV